MTVAPAAEAAPPPQAGPQRDEARRPLRAAWIVGGLALALVLGITVGESLGWPFLAAPMQRWLASTLQRDVSLAADPQSRPQVRIGLIGGIRLDAGRILIGAPPWSHAPHMLLARNASLRLGYGDLWRARSGGPLHIRSLDAQQLDLEIERLADGRASWQFGVQPPKEPAAPAPSFGRVEVEDGTLRYRDAVVDATIEAHFTLVDRSGAPVALGASGPASAGSAAIAGAHRVQGEARGLRVVATGRYRDNPVKAELATSGVLPWISQEATAPAVPVRLKGSIGRARLEFDGTATDALHLAALKGSFRLAGPSLAAVGDPLGVTLPTTPPFQAEGVIVKDAKSWQAVFEQAWIGSSRLHGQFTYDAGGDKPLLSGQLLGAKVVLADLAPAIGANVPEPPVSAAADTQTQAKAQPTARPRPQAGGVRRGGRVLPTREFDLARLRAMDANVLVDFTEFDLGSRYLEPLKPMHGHLRLRDGVLTLSDLDARTAQGRLVGELQLDGRGEFALWRAALRWTDVRLERWIRQVRENSAPPYIAGRLRGIVDVTGQGRSTAQILSTLKGHVALQLQDGKISHLAVEAAGIDIAESLGVMISGDEALNVQCGVADFTAQGGVLRPRVFVIDTSDSALWVSGAVSLADETLDLRAVVTPKDFSPLTLRTPLHVRGPFADPQISLEKAPLGRKLGVAALLALVNPIAALLPLLDTGDADEAQRALAQGCRSLVERSGVARSGTRPAAAKAAQPGAAASVGRS